MASTAWFIISAFHDSKSKAAQEIGSDLSEETNQWYVFSFK